MDLQRYKQCKLFKTGTNNLSSTSITESNKLSKEFQLIYDEALIKFIAKKHISFSLLSGKDWEEFLGIFTGWKTKIPKVQIKHRVTLSRQAAKKADDVRLSLVSIVEKYKNDLKCVCLTTDIWTSRNMDPFISLTLQFLTSEMEMIRMVPYVSHFEAKHNATNINLELSSMMEELGLGGPEIVKYICTDNASNMKAAIHLNGEMKDIRCHPHLLQLVVLDSLKAFSGNICDKTQELASTVRHSPKKKSELKEACSTVRVKFKTLKCANKTRWNSLYANLESVQYLKNALRLLVDDTESDWDKFMFNAIEWKQIDAMVLLLDQVAVTSRTFEAEKTSTSNLVIQRLFTLSEYLARFRRSPGNDRFDLISF